LHGAKFQTGIAWICDAEDEGIVVGHVPAPWGFSSGHVFRAVDIRPAAALEEFTPCHIENDVANVVVRKITGEYLNGTPERGDSHPGMLVAMPT